MKPFRRSPCRPPDRGALMLRRIARFSYRRRRRVLITWIIALVGLSALGGAVGSSFARSFTAPGTESQRATDLLQARFPARAGDEGQIVFTDKAGVRDAAVEQRMTAVFGSVLAMGLPIMTALFGIGIGLAFVNILSHVMSTPDFTTQLASMIGIGVGIDYALFIVTRYREGLHSGLDPENAVVRAIDTSGRAVVFAGMTVVISLFGLFLMGLSFVRGLAVGTSLTVALVMLASITLLPAVLGFAGTTIDRLSVPGRRVSATSSRRSMWFRWSREVQHRPKAAFGAALAVLVVLAIPLFSIRLGFSDAGSNPTSDTTRRAYDLVARGFGRGFNGPLIL